jgi:type I restriction enzyme S subunit
MKQKTQTSTEEMFNQAHQGQKRTGVVVGMNLQRVPISEVAEVNPRLRSKPRQDELVSFVPMAAVSEKTVSIESPVDRPFAEVAKGFTPFERGDVIVAKITPCFENGKMAYAVDLPRAVGAGSTEFHVLRPKPSLNGAYLFHMLRLPAVRADGARKMQGAAGQRRVPAGFFASL